MTDNYRLVKVLSLALEMVKFCKSIQFCVVFQTDSIGFFLILFLCLKLILWLDHEQLLLTLFWLLH